MKNEFSANSQNCRKQLKLWFDSYTCEIMTLKEVLNGPYIQFLNDLIEGNDTERIPFESVGTFLDETERLYEVSNANAFLSGFRSGRLYFSLDDETLYDGSMMVDEYAMWLHCADDNIKTISELCIQNWMDFHSVVEVSNSEAIIERVIKGELK